MKPPAWRLARDIYPVSFAVQTRYRDMDVLHHINNIAQAAYYDEARHRLTQHIFQRMGDITGVRVVTADSHVNYLAEVFHSDDLEVRTGVLRIGTASYQYGQAMFQDGRCVGVCNATIVQATRAGTSPLAPRMRELLQEFVIKAPIDAHAG
jgi:acyl-CoA thioester hydrolase